MNKYISMLCVLFQHASIYRYLINQCTHFEMVIFNKLDLAACSLKRGRAALNSTLTYVLVWPMGMVTC